MAMPTERMSTRAIPRVNQPAPDFEANTTHGVKRLADYRGNWLVLFSDPNEFTPVFTTEFTLFARRYRDFKAHGTDLLGLSTDPHYAHRRWVRNSTEKFGIHIPFPIIADLSKAIADAYGMLPYRRLDTTVERVAIIVDDASVLRAAVQYPATEARTVDEVLRLLRALQTSDELGVAMPPRWCSSDEVATRLPSMDAANPRPSSRYEIADLHLYKEAI